MANLITVQLRRGEGQPWGFRLQGGKDFSAPLVLQRVNGGSVADQAGLMPGDALVKVNSTEVFNLRHKEAQDVIVAAGNSFELTVSRGTAWRPSVTPTGSIPSPSPSLPGNITPVTKTSLAATPQPVQHIGSGHNQAAKPFPAQQPQQQQPQEQVNGSDPIKSIVNMQYNTPVAMYSDETIAETLSSQAEVLAGGVLGVNFKKNERKYSPANSEVYKLLHEQGDNPEPAYHQQQPQQQVQQQQHQQHYQQQQQQQSNSVVTKHVTAPVDKPPSNTNGLPAGQNICSSCDRLIVGVFVRIKDKNLHADCFKCATCGTSLKNQGYFNLNGKLYCDIHARLAALQSPPPGTNGMVPVTIPKPGQKSGVQAISAALNAHANLNGRSQSPYAANNQNNITPKPFGAAPSPLVQPPSSFPPVAGSVPTPFSAAITGQAQAPAPAAAPTVLAPQPASYPPVATPAAPAVQAPAPAPAPASVAPAAAPAAVPTPQGAYAHYLDPELYGDEDEDGDAQVQKPAESPIPPFSWPPKRVEDEKVPIATPLYVPPPETQRVVVKPLVYVPPPPKEKSKSPPKKEQQIQQEQPEQEEELEVEEQTIVNKSVQSKSAPELSRRRSSAHDQSQQEEESYDTYTTTTSTSASSEEYRMYSTQTSQPIVTYYDTPVIEMDYPFGSGQRSTQASTGAMSDASYTHFVFRDPPMEPESVGPSVEPSVEPEPIVEQPKTPLQENTKAQKRVEFVEYRKELERFLKAEQEASEAAEKLRNEIQEVAEEYTIPHYQLPVIDSAKPAKELPKKIVPNPVPKQWQSKLVQMLCIAPNDPVRLTQEQIEEAKFMKSRNEAYIREKEESKIRQLEALKRQVDDLERRMGKTEEPEPEPYPSIPHPPLEIPRKGAVMAKVLASSTTKSERFPTYLPAPVVPLPEESAPYVPTFKPSMEPIRNDKISSYRVSPFLEALTTAPYTPFQTFGTEIPSQMENMPVPSGRISMTDALATVSDRPYTPFKEVKFERSDMYQKLLQEQPSIQTDPDKNFSAFASVGGNRTPVPFKPIIPEIRVPEPEPEPEPEKVEEPPQPEPEPEPEKPKKKLPPYPRKDAGAGHYSLAPKRDNTKSPLNHPAEIPTYQRKWFELPTQNPTRTPEPEELRQNVPLAFVDTHSQSHLAKPIARCNAVDIRDQVQLKKTNPFTTIHNRTIPVAQLPIAVPEDDAELAHFNNAHGRLQAKGVVFDRGQSFTPSLILSKHSTTIPYYQHQLGFEEYFAESKSFDGRNTPMKQCRKSPAFGPPPNPLKPAVPPSRDNIPVESGLYLSMGKLQGTPWYAHSDHVPVDIKQKMQQQQHGMGPGYTGYAQQQRNVHYQEKPVAVQIETQGNTTVQTRSQESALREQASSERTINSASQVGNALIQKRTRIVEEHEHTQEARTVEIAKFSSKIKEDEVPQKGFVAQQTRRFSGQDDALNIPPQMSEAAAVEATPSQPSEPQCTAQFFPQQTSQPSASMFPSSINKPTAQPTSQFFPQQTSQPSAPMFPSANKKPEVFGDKFPTVSSRKASILNPIHPPRSPTPTSGFKAQFNEFMGGAGPLPTLPMQREEPEPVQSWPPVLPSSITSNSNPQQPSVAVAPMKQAVATAPPAALQQQQVASFNGRRSSINNNSNANAINNSTIGFSNITLDSGSDNHFKYSDRPPVPSAGSAAFNKGRAACQTTAPTRGRGVMNKAVAPGGRIPLCGCCSQQIRGPFITALGRIWCPDHFICHNGNCKRALADIGFVEEKGDLYCEYCFEEFLAPVCSKCNARVKGDCLNAIGKQFHPECFKCTYCGKQFGNSPFFLEEGDPYCETDWNELFTTKCFACGFPVEAGDKWVEALNNNYHSQCFNCTSCKKNLEGQSFFAKGGRPFCKNHAR